MHPVFPILDAPMTVAVWPGSGERRWNEAADDADTRGGDTPAMARRRNRHRR